jgi:hypothetical protein
MPKCRSLIQRISRKAIARTMKEFYARKIPILGGQQHGRLGPRVGVAQHRMRRFDIELKPCARILILRHTVDERGPDRSAFASGVTRRALRPSSRQLVRRTGLQVKPSKRRRMDLHEPSS